ncbi:M24 family metallopeptidase [Paraburkholderia phenoliruptrix]|uniref:M24 family metallopeptidase n=1 Tax=Paraburkholderia phenoliruptrix TaxID=252970 RepID=UPI0028699F2E|nr:Xaa-Pro peptidase family protein [Paraburkholderia phenoliruptrix]WMY10885.1 Xaa-Pro peptidase family protein [Paraburkholderia phenoliruptrix]
MDFPIHEYKQRLTALQQQLEKNRLPAVLLHQPENIRYISGFYTTGYFSYHALLVPMQGDPILVLRDMEVAAARKTAWVSSWTTYADAKDPLPAAIAASVEALNQAGLSASTIGVDLHSWFLTPERLNELKAQARQATFVAEPKLVDHLRLVKSELEIEVYRRAAQAVQAGMRAAIGAVRTGVTERELAASTYAALVAGGSESPVDGVITSGERTFELHGRFTDRQVQPGDQVYYELTGSVDWYVARLMRTAVNGKPTDDQKRVADSIIRVQDDGIALMQPGAVGADVDKVFREGLIKSGVRTTYTNRTAYSIGLNHRPSAGEFIRELVPGVDWTFQPGMVFHVLMMGQGVGFSETVLITEKGPERLTTMERSLFSSETSPRS